MKNITTKVAVESHENDGATLEVVTTVSYNVHRIGDDWVLYFGDTYVAEASSVVALARMLKTGEIRY